jgi:hypothetical protein
MQLFGQKPILGGCELLSRQIQKPAVLSPELIAATLLE